MKQFLGGKKSRNGHVMRNCEIKAPRSEKLTRKEKMRTQTRKNLNTKRKKCKVQRCASCAEYESREVSKTFKQLLMAKM